MNRVNSYYTHLIEARGLKIQAICAVMRKLLHAIYAMLKRTAKRSTAAASACFAEAAA